MPRFVDHVKAFAEGVHAASRIHRESTKELERTHIATATLSLRSNPTQIPDPFVPNGC